LAVGATAKAEKSQERFYDALRYLFVGAKVEGEASFIVLSLKRPEGIRLQTHEADSMNPDNLAKAVSLI
jgi:hypothetical protein